MTAHLLQITVGPVQEFIAQARRTRDLWYGSHLLSEVSRAVARSLHGDSRVVLIFPAFGRARAGEQSSDARLEECVTPFHPKDHPDAGKAPASVANVILAKVESASAGEVRDIATAARNEADAFLHRIAAKIREDCARLLATGINEVWNEQVRTFIEFAAAWTPVGQGGEAHSEARDRLTKAIAARKNLRDFEPWRHHREGAPKSALDGARASVLTEPKDRPAKLVRKWRLGEAEQLDAIGLIKRTGGDDLADRPKEDKHDLQFVPIFNVALAPWMQLARTTDAGAFKSALDAAAEAGVSMVKRDIACGRPLCDRDASIFLQSRWWPEFKEQSLLQECARKPDGSVDQQEWRQKIQVWGREHIGPLFELMAEPHPYVACLVADGDGMGAAIDALGTAEEHRAFSAELAKFARAAREIVECEAHVGSLVYSGGDDVLAFLPVATALACADELRKRFADIVGPALSKPGGRLKDGVKRLPTLSVGIGIGHVMESMATLLELGRRAEKVAKGGHLKREGKDRNALAIVLDKRSGGTCEWRSQWSDWVAEGGPAGRLLADGSLLDPRGRDSKAPVLPIRKVHQIAALLRRLPEPGGPDPASLSPFNAVLLPELRRTLSRVDGGAGELTVSQVALSAGETETYAENYRRTKAWIDRMLIARVFAESEPRTRAGGAAAEAAA